MASMLMSGKRRARLPSTNDGGGGGIRTHGACAHTLSKRADSAALAPLPGTQMVQGAEADTVAGRTVLGGEFVVPYTPDPLLGG